MKLLTLSSPQRQIGHLLAALLLFALTATIYQREPSIAAQSAPSEIVISQVYGGGGNAGATFKNDFIELFNRGTAPVDVTGWSVQYAAATSAIWRVTVLSGSIAPGHYYLVQEAQGDSGSIDLPAPDATGTTAISAVTGKVALVKHSTTLSSRCPPDPGIVDFVGYGSNASCFEGSGPTGNLSNTTAALRVAEGCGDTDSNNADFVIGTPIPRNSASPASYCGVTTVPTVAGTANPKSVTATASVLLIATVTPGVNPLSTNLIVTGDLSSIGRSATQQFFDDGANGDAVAGDGVFSFQIKIPSDATIGAKTLTITVADAQSRSSKTTIALFVEPPMSAIHDLQGSGNVSPFDGAMVSATGIVTGRKSNGFFIQTPDAEIDADPNTSEGIFVYTSSAPSAAAEVGNLVKVIGKLQEFRPSQDPNSPPLTEISGLLMVAVISTGNALPAPVTLTPDDTRPDGSIEQLEKFEGMRVHVESLTVIAPTQGSVNEASATAISDGVFYGVITGVARPFREPGIEVPDPVPSGAPCCIPRFDANPERLRVDSNGQPGAPRLEVTTGAVVANITGLLDYAARAYTILPDPSPAASPIVSGNISAVSVPTPMVDEFTVASFNMERFFDTTDDRGFGEPVLTQTASEHRLNKASLAIRNVMRSPDIIGVEDVENLSTLQAIADQVNRDAAAAGDMPPNYQAYLIEGNDVGGIDVGFLVKSGRVMVMDVTQAGKDATFINPSNGHQALLNDRPPLVLRASILNPSGAAFPITVIVNHLRSLLAINDPADGPRVRAKRQAQAEFLATLIQARQAANPDEHIVCVGDFNAFQFSDGYVDVMGTIKGTPAPADQVFLASSTLVNPALIDLGDLIEARARYSFSFNGSAQELDHVLMSGNLRSQFSGFHYARNNADFPESWRSDATRPERVSDHDMPVAYFKLSAPQLPDAQIGWTGNVSTLKTRVLGYQPLGPERK